MDYDEQKAILAELARMDPSIEDAEPEEQYRRCYEVWNMLPDWTQFSLTEMYDAQTFQIKWYWRRKS